MDSNPFNHSPVHEGNSELQVSDLKNKVQSLLSLAIHVVAEVEALEQVRMIDLHEGIDLQGEIRQYEKTIIRRTLQLTGGNQKKAATLLGILPTTLNEKIKRYRIRADDTA
jgi:DNA-binding NtrC family response regulator